MEYLSQKGELYKKMAIHFFVRIVGNKNIEGLKVLEFTNNLVIVQDSSFINT